jgi:tetratricopeptide (TPR) repeat protein
MSRRSGLARWVAGLGSMLIVLAATLPGAGQAPGSPEAEEAREKQAAERFLSLLEKNPRRGTALDRVYGYHVERGTLDAFIKTYADRVEKDPRDGTGWLILGLLEAQRGRDAAAVAALQRAEETRPDDPMPPYYLGQALVLVGQPDEAAAAFERALNRKPKRNELLEIFQALGRVYQRSQKTEQAMAVWGRLEAQFPDDLRVQEQIAAALAEEGQAEQALPRYEALAKKIQDPFRQAQMAMTVADLKVRLGRTEPALRDFEALLGKLRPDSWLYRETRRKIDEVFLRNDDQAGLADYYEKWIAKNPDDVEALVRLGRGLAAQGRAAEARVWYDKAIKLAPSRRDLRLALISQLVQDQKIAAAAAQYAELDRAEPNNPDTLRDWGGLLLRDTSRPEAQRKAEAAKVWRRLLESKPNDPVTTAQVADLFRQAEMTDDALALYRKAVELAPGNAQYREYLGEYLHALKRPDEALAAWKPIADGPNRNAKNLARLAEVLSGFGYLKESIAPMTEAVGLEGDDFTLRLKLADLLYRVERFDEARAQLDAAERLAENDEERGAALDAQVKNDVAAGQVAARVEALRQEIDAGDHITAAQLVRLARYLEADGKLPEAVAATGRAIEVDPRSVPAWALAARLRESSGNLGDAASAFRRLAEIDRRNRTEYLTGVAKLEGRLGRAEAALQAGRDLIAAAPGNPESYEFFAELCFQLGRNDEGLDALRRAVRVNPNETKVVLTLAETLAAQFRTEEAIEMYWRAFEKSADLDGKLSIITRLTDQYLQRNQLDRLLARLQREQTDEQGQQQQRELAICLAQAYASSGDLGSARSELERLLSANSRDVQLLQQLSKLTEEEGDIDSAAKYQKQLLDLAPSDEGSTRLANLYVRLGEIDEAQSIWSRMASGQNETFRTFQALDSLLGSDRPKAVLEVTEALLRRDPRDWEALYREGVALAALRKNDEAQARFQALVDLRLDNDLKSAMVKARTRDPKLQAAGARPSQLIRAKPTPLEERISATSQVRMATGLENRYYYGSRAALIAWAPPDYGQARMAALGWLASLAQKQGKEAEEKFLSGIRAAKDKSPRDPAALWDWYLLSLVRYDNPAAFEAARALARAAPNDPEAQWVYLNGLGTRQQGQGRTYVVAGEIQDNVPPLPPDELEYVLSSYRSLRQHRPDLAQAGIIQNVSTELRRAKRTEEADTFYREAVDSAEQLPQVAAAFGLAAERGDVETLLRLSEKYDRLTAGQSTSYYIAGLFYFQGAGYAMGRAMGICSEGKRYDDILKLLDAHLASARRKAEQAAGSPRRRVSSGYPPGYVPNYQIYIGRNPRSVRFAFPVPNEYYDANAIMLLRNAYEIYKKDDLTTDLIAHFRKQADAAPTAADGLFPRLALSYLLWWEDDKDAAIGEYTRAIEATPASSDLRLSLAELYEQGGDPAEALAVVEAVKPLDNTTMQRREEQALRLAVLTGDITRARQAAERLFGLRLDTDTQVRLAGQMNQLGMHDLADSVLARARRRAGGKASALVGLMLQYQQQDKMSVAVQVAMQILRGTTPTRNVNSRYFVSNSTDPDAARAAAIQVLARSGNIQTLIDRAQEQLKKAPTAVQIRQTLADYYKAAGKRDEANAELEKIVELRPDDATLRFQIAQQLVQNGKAAEAIPHFKAAIRKEASLLGQAYYDIQNAFRQANKTDELVQLLDEIDMRTIGQPYYVMNLIQTMMYDDRERDNVMPLFRKAWEAFPQERSNLVAYVRHDQLWQLPEMYDYARQAIIPDPLTFIPSNQWYIFQNIISYSSEGGPNSVISRMLDLAASQNKLDELAAEVAAAREKLPGWQVGDAILALIECRKGQYDQARKRLAGLLEEAKKSETIIATALWVIGAELEKHSPTRDLAIAFYEATLTGQSDNPYSIFNYGISPVRRLVTLYERDGRRDDIRRVLLEFTRPREFPQYDPNDIRQYRVSGLTQAGRQLAELGYAAEAIPMLSEALVEAEAMADEPYNVGNRERMLAQTRDTLSQSLQSLDAEQFAALLKRLLEPKSDKKAEPSQAVDLALLVHPRELDKAAVRSLFAEAVAACAGHPDPSSRLDEALQKLHEDHPDDLSVSIALALAALAGPDRSRDEPALDALDEALKRNPLEPLPPGARANARQRAEAARRLPLWLVARACWQRDETRWRGDALADLALQAAQRQADNRWSMAMLREQGQRALDRGDRAGAEAAWGRMLELILDRGRAKSRAEAQPDQAPAAPAPAPPATAPQTKGVIRRTAYQAAQTKAAVIQGRMQGIAVPAPAPSGVPILVIDRFDQAAQVAQLAAEHGLHELSAKALREALAGGPPVAVASPNQSGRRYYVNGMEVTSVDQITPRIIARLAELETAWQRQHAPEALVYEALRDAALPEGRPTEVFLYAEALDANTIRRPRSLGAMLASWAAHAGKSDDLLKRLEARQSQPLAEIPATVLRAQLALAGKADDAVNKELGEIAERFKRNATRATADLACHVAIPALDRPETAAAAQALIDTTLKTYEATNAFEPTHSLLLLIARQHLKSGDADTARKRFDLYLEAIDRNYSRYSGDYPIYQRKLALQQIVSEYARAGLADDALTLLGRFVDAPAYSGGDPPLGAALDLLLNQLAKRPAAERYETLRAWTMPAADRRALRVVSSADSDDRSARNQAPGLTGKQGISSTAAALVAAAREAGTLDALAAEARQAAQQKLEQAEALATLVDLARGRSAEAAPWIEARRDALAKENATPSEPNPDPNRPVPAGRSAQPPLVFSWNDYLVARAATEQEDPALRNLGLSLAETLLERAKKLNRFEAVTLLHREIALARARQIGAKSVLERPDGGLAAWHPASLPSGLGDGSGQGAWLWVAHEGHVAHVSGPGQDLLLLDRPLTGTYEFSVDAYVNSWAESVLSHGGLVIEPFWVGGNSQVFSIGGSETAQRPWKLTRQGDFNRMTVQATPEKVRYLVNGHLFYEEDNPGPTAPWLGLFTRRERQAVWRNLTLKGQPEVPDAVPLSHGDRLEGWVSAYYNETQPPRRTTTTTDMYGNVTTVAIRPSAGRRALAPLPINPDDFDWSARDGEIRGRRRPPTAQPNYYDPRLDNSAIGQSRLYYYRPLRDGDNVSYEFFYEPGQVIAHPTFGQLAFLLEPEGVVLHEMTPLVGNTTGLAADNTTIEPDCRRGPTPIPLKADDWNALRLSLKGGTLTIELNGQTIYERPVEPGAGRHFGFYHDKDRTSSRVRNVVLRGQWPRSIPADLLARADARPDTDADRRARHAMIGEDVFALEAENILHRAETLEPAARFESLAGWVLPGPDHPVFRLAGVFTPGDPVPSSSGEARPGGRIRAPALELIDAAAALGKLDELAARVEAAKVEGAEHQSGRQALLALIALARGDDARVVAALNERQAAVVALPPATPRWQRWPDLLLASRAIERPALREPALALLGPVIDQAQKEPSLQGLWEHHAKNLRARARLLALSDPPWKPFGSDPGIAGWSPVVFTRPQSRGTGEPPAQWVLRDGQITHHPGHAEDFLYLNVPLQGDFQLDCELTSFDWREIRVSYGGLSVGPKHDLKHLTRSRLGRPLPETALNPPLEPIGDWFAYRLVVQGGMMTGHVNGRQVFQAPLPAGSDPWLALHCGAGLTGSARTIRISGNPKIPEALDLSASSDLAGWRADEYDESTTGENADWDKRGDEIVGRRRDELAGVKQESVLRYHRPMFEDGAISYEFYHEPGQSLVHPALDRLVLLLESDGVKVHWLTDAQYERGGLAPDNAQVEPENRRGPASLPLKPKAWNTAELAIEGARLVLKLNGETVYERPIEPSNRRAFGLFRHADTTEARVRNVTYRGQWPRSLPESVKATPGGAPAGETQSQRAPGP